MTDRDEGDLGRGAHKRREAQRQRRRREALRWWAQPAVLIFLLAVAIAGAGWVLVLRQAAHLPVTEATVDGLHMRLVEARWLLDQMDHGENFQKPSTMMPDMPPWGQQRVTLELTLDNLSAEQRVFNGGELFLVPRYGGEVGPVGADVGYVELGPGQAFNTAVQFDFDTRQPYGSLHVEWRHRGRTTVFPLPEPAEHYHLRPRGGEVALPPDARLVMPLGDAKRGARLYAGIFGCAACHGDPAVPGSNNVGPHLGRIGDVAAGRIGGMAAEQYIYQSILEPNAFIAPECRGEEPCASPSAMPEYASLMSLQDVADLLVYLSELKQR